MNAEPKQLYRHDPINSSNSTLRSAFLWLILHRPWGGGGGGQRETQREVRSLMLDQASFKPTKEPLGINVENKNSKAHPGWTESESLGGCPGHLDFSKHTSQMICTGTEVWEALGGTPLSEVFWEMLAPAWVSALSPGGGSLHTCGRRCWPPASVPGDRHPRRSA